MYIRLAQLFIIFPTFFILLRVQSYLTGAFFVATIFLFLNGKLKPFENKRKKIMVGLQIIFMLYLGSWWLLSPSSNGFQNIATIFLFLVTVNATGLRLKVESSLSEKSIKFCFLLCSVGYLIQTFLEGFGSDSLYSPRATSSILMIGSIFCVYLYVERKCGISTVAVVNAALIATLSRASISGALIGVQLFLLLCTKRKESLKYWFLVFFIQFQLLLVFILFEPLKRRFTIGDNASLFGLDLNTSGRANIWRVTLDEWKKSLLFGHGPGATESMLQKYYLNISHPHNEYLRIIHDYGLAGLTLWIFFLLMMFHLLIRKRNLAKGNFRSIENFRLALFTSFAFSIFFENYLVYIFFIIPFAVCFNLSKRE